MWVLCVFLASAVIHEPTSGLFHLLLLLTQLLVRSSSFPAHSSDLCAAFGSMIHQLEKLFNASKKMHNLTSEELSHFSEVEDKLKGLPSLEHIATHFRSLKVNESLLQLHKDTESFRLHVDWLKAAKENFSLPLLADRSAGSSLLQLSDLIRKSLHKINQEVPEVSIPVFPDVSNAFDALMFSVEISERLQPFCRLSKRILLHICPKHRPKAALNS
ncbi:putative LOC107395788-like protein [Nothobranchius furzeri]|uniref:LOC107395788-like protein n=1 Tax=Nothobranchius furzeri TaxID=105023 RepID=A0A9D2Y006_NOTFU|nr:putative LOC107395788-like protein [Nothobranchius furzeri]